MLVALWIGLWPNRALADSSPTIYFYNPEININRNSILKDNVDQYLRQHGAFVFQPVTDRHTFEGILARNERHLFMMSSWHFAQIHPNNPQLTARLVGQRNDSTYYHKLMVRGASALSHNSRDRIVIAAAGNEEFSEILLSDIKSSHPNLLPERYQFLLVPKDMDALMAVNFGMADAALCSEQSWAALAELYPAQHSKLQVLAQSDPLLHMQVITPSEMSAAEKTLFDAILQMSNSVQGRRTLRMLGLEDWKYMEATTVNNNERKEGTRHD